jgi:hypothetical protein
MREWKTPTENLVIENKVLRHVEFNNKHVSITALQISTYTYKGESREKIYKACILKWFTESSI